MMFRRLPRRGRIPVLVLAAIWLLAAGSPSSRAASVPAGQVLPPPGVSVEYTPLEAETFQAAAAESPADRHWLLPAALAAAGERDEARIERAVRKVETWGEELSRSVESESDVPRRAAIVLEFLHARVLQGGYRPDANDLSATIEGGGYNCVSSTVLFQCLAEHCGLQVSAAESPGHVYSVIHSPSGPFDVETTCREWFSSVAAAKDPRPSAASRELTTLGLAALVYYNAGVDHLAARRFEAAIAANLKALQLDPANSAARSNLLAGLNNWALDLNDRQDFAGAVRLLEHGLRIAPEHRPFNINRDAVQQRWSEATVAGTLRVP
jgi:tetratricopeptide (TPR) repeat protein